MLHKVTNQTRGSILLGPWDRSYVFKGTFHCETPSFKKSTFITSVSSSTFLQAFNAIPGTTWVHEMTSMCSTSKPSYRMSLSRAKHIKKRFLCKHNWREQQLVKVPGIAKWFTPYGYILLVWNVAPIYLINPHLLIFDAEASNNPKTHAFPCVKP